MKQITNTLHDRPWRGVHPSTEDYDHYWKRQPRRVIARRRLHGSTPSVVANQLLHYLGFKQIFNASKIYDVVTVEGHARTYTQREVLEIFVSRLRTFKACRLRWERHYKRMIRFSEYIVHGTWSSDEVDDLRALRADIPEEDVIAAMERQRDSDMLEARFAREHAFNLSWPIPGD